MSQQQIDDLYQKIDTLKKDLSIIDNGVNVELTAMKKVMNKILSDIKRMEFEKKHFEKVIELFVEFIKKGGK